MRRGARGASERREAPSSASPSNVASPAMPSVVAPSPVVPSTVAPSTVVSPAASSPLSAIAVSTSLSRHRPSQRRPFQNVSCRRLCSSSVASPVAPSVDAEPKRCARRRGGRDGRARARLQHAIVARLLETGARWKRLTNARDAREERFDPPHFFTSATRWRARRFADGAEAYRKAVVQRRGCYSRAQNISESSSFVSVVGRRPRRLCGALRLENGKYPEASYNMGRVYGCARAGLAIREGSARSTCNRTRRRRARARTHARARRRPRTRARRADSFSARFNARARACRAPSPSRAATRRGRPTSHARNAAAATMRSNVRSIPHSSKRKRRRALGSARGRGFARARHRAAGMSFCNARVRRARRAQRGTVTLYRRVLAERGGYFPPANLELGYALINLKRNEEALAMLVPVTSTTPNVTRRSSTSRTPIRTSRQLRSPRNPSPAPPRSTATTPTRNSSSTSAASAKRRATGKPRSPRWRPTSSSPPERHNPRLGASTHRTATPKLAAPAATTKQDPAPTPKPAR